MRLQRFFSARLPAHWMQTVRLSDAWGSTRIMWMWTPVWCTPDVHSDFCTILELTCHLVLGGGSAAGAAALEFIMRTHQDLPTAFQAHATHGFRPMLHCVVAGSPLGAAEFGAICKTVADVAGPVYAS